MKLKEITKVFVDALKSGDSATIYEIAVAVDIVESFGGKMVEKYRASILLAKSTQKRTGASLTIHQMAKRIEWPRRNTKDGLSQLRRLCKSLGYTLAKAKKQKTNNISKGR